MRSTLTLNFNDKYATPCESSIQNGLSPMVIVRRANLTSRGWLSCSDFLQRNKIDRSHNQSNAKPTKIVITTTQRHMRWRLRRRDSLSLREAIPLWFAISSPLIGVMIGLLGAWFVTWLTT